MRRALLTQFPGGSKYYSAVLADSPVGYWRLSESSGTVAADSSGFGRNGTYVGGPTGMGAPGAIAGNGALSLDGVNDTVTFGNPAAFQLTSATLELWVKTSSPGSSYRSLVAKQFAFGIFLVDGVLGAYDWSASAVRTTGVDLADGLWHHVAFVVNSGVVNGSYIYVDGTQKWNGLYTVQGQSDMLSVGSNANSQYLNGSVDEVAIYNTLLSASRVAAHYSAR